MRWVPLAAAVFSLGAIGLSSVAVSQGVGWGGSLVPTDRPVTAIRQVGGDVFVQAGDWFRATLCGDAICLDRARPNEGETASDGIPGGTIAYGFGPGISQAWYAAPTSRYDHGVLGDQIEGGSLVVIDEAGRRHELVLPADQVFEDLTPRIVDLNGDGVSEVITIRSGIAVGASVAVYGFLDGVLTELASTPPIGQARRWLNISGIADFDGDGRLDIALVKTPHIGGTLEFWTMRGGSLVRLATGSGFSNHAIGSPELGMSAVADFDGDAVADLAVPNAARDTLRFVRLSGDRIVDLGSVALGGSATTAIGVLCVEHCSDILLARADGSLVRIRRDP